MSIQNLNAQEVQAVAGGLSLTVGNNPIVNGTLNIDPNGVFTLLNAVLGQVKSLVSGLLAGLPSLGGLLGSLTAGISIGGNVSGS